MTPFGVVRSPHTIIFGIGQRGALGRSARALGTSALICTDARLGADPDFVAMVDDLKRSGVLVRIYDRTVPELPLSCLDESLAAATGFGADLVIGIGGGSCLDLAKATAIVLTHGGHIRDYYGEFKVPGPVLPLITVPTTSGTGSEVTPVAVLSDPERTMKVGVSSPHIIAHTAICDPELTFSCPPQLTAVSGSDALTHAIEAFTAIRRPPTPTLVHEHVFIGKNALSDQHALFAIKLIMRSLRIAVENGGDEAARVDMMRGALSAGLAFGTAGTAAAHAIQYPVGALTHTPHGMGVAVLMPYVMNFNRTACMVEFSDLATVMGIPRSHRTDDELSQAVVVAVTQLFDSVGIPATLAELGLPEDKIDWTAEQSLAAQRLIKNNPKPLDRESLKAIIVAAYNGTRV